MKWWTDCLNEVSVTLCELCVHCTNSQYGAESADMPEYMSFKDHFFKRPEKNHLHQNQGKE
jgi:hypothetical protein